MYNSSFMLDKLNKQKEEIENLIHSYQSIGQQIPVNNFINASQSPTKDLIEWRVLNENEEIKKLKEMIKDEHSKSTSTVGERVQPVTNDDVDVKSKPKTSSKYISK